MTNIYLAGERILPEDLPDFKAVINRGETKFKVTVTARAIESGNVIELKTTTGGNGDASDLTVLLTFVSES